MGIALPRRTQADFVRPARDETFGIRDESAQLACPSLREIHDRSEREVVAAPKVYELMAETPVISPPELH